MTNRLPSLKLTPEQQLEQIQAKITKANQLLDHLERETAEAKRQRKAISEDIEAERKRAVQQRVQELAEVQSAADAKLAVYRQEIRALTDEQRHLVKRNTTLKSEIAAATADLEGLASRKIQYAQDVEDAQRQLARAHAEVGSLDARKTHLDSQIGPLTEEIANKTVEIGQLDAKILELTTKLSTLDSQFASRKEAYEAQITEWLAKIDDLKIRSVELSKQNDAWAADLAAREKALDERGENLRRREFKVNQDEQRVARNAGLLQL